MPARWQSMACRQDGRAFLCSARAFMSPVTNLANPSRQTPSANPAFANPAFGDPALECLHKSLTAAACRSRDALFPTAQSAAIQERHHGSYPTTRSSPVPTPPPSQAHRRGVTWKDGEREMIVVEPEAMRLLAEQAMMDINHLLRPGQSGPAAQDPGRSRSHGK